MDVSDYQKAIDTSSFFVSKGKVETALEVIQEAFRILYLEKETDEPEEKPEYDKIETLLTKKYLALKLKQEKLQKRQTYFRTFMHTLVVCLVISSFMIVGSFFIKNAFVNITDTITDRLESRVLAKLTPDKTFKKALKVLSFYGSLDKFTQLKIVANIKQDPELFYQLGLMQEKNGDIDDAIRKLEWALYLMPDSAKFNKKLEGLKQKLVSKSAQTTKD
jgi:tetratricopeptide (TPR) repeat protein